MDTNIGDSLDGDHDSNIIHEESRNESKKFHSPLKVRSRGRPPTKRKQSKLEQIEKRAKAKSRKKGSTIDRKQDELSNIEQIDKFSALLLPVSSLIQEDTNDGLMVDAHDSLFVPRRRECKDEF
ncbi:hypothetical protein ZIOFF_007206 [Zingiber officinale]|uniref:Uncharacterized protein n=1 Tax=Zingiber officinale TaxID=94328 RepID=A0A8J5LSU6_ZINOF|nr:hypothetical protein ZIOFF_007206 [Zingiber officinale]